MASLVLILVIIAFIYLTIAGAVRAFRNNDTGWSVGIVVAWIVGLGWLVGAIYLGTHPKQR